MTGELEVDLLCAIENVYKEKLIIFLRRLSRLGSSDNQIVSRIWTTNILNLDELGLLFNALPEKGLTEKKKQSKGDKKSKQGMAAMFIVAADGSFVFEPLLFGDQKYHGVLDLSKIIQDQCLFIIFQIAKHGWIVILWRLFLAN